jgi:RNA polymerase sigma-70 factor (ECF subfamily)
VAEPKTARRDSGEAELLRSYEGALRSFFSRRMANRDEVDDLIQEAFARLLSSREERDLAYPFAYLFRIASNLLSDHYRRRARTLLNLEITPDDVRFAVAPDQEHACHLADLQERLAAALAVLPDRCRQVFVMRRFRNMSTPAIASELGISHRMVQKHLTRAMTHIYLWIGPDGSKLP